MTKDKSVDLTLRRTDKPRVYVQWKLAGREKYPAEEMAKHEEALTLLNKSCKIFDELLCEQYECVFDAEYGDTTVELLSIHTPEGDVYIGVPFSEIHTAVLCGIEEKTFLGWIMEILKGDGDYTKTLWDYSHEQKI